MMASRTKNLRIRKQSSVCRLAPSCSTRTHATGAVNSEGASSTSTIFKCSPKYIMTQVAKVEYDKDSSASLLVASSNSLYSNEAKFKNKISDFKQNRRVLRKKIPNVSEQSLQIYINRDLESAQPKTGNITAPEPKTHIYSNEMAMRNAKKLSNSCTNCPGRNEVELVKDSQKIKKPFNKKTLFIKNSQNEQNNENIGNKPLPQKSNITLGTRPQMTKIIIRKCAQPITKFQTYLSLHNSQKNYSQINHEQINAKLSYNASNQILEAAYTNALPELEIATHVTVPVKSNLKPSYSEREQKKDEQMMKKTISKTSIFNGSELLVENSYSTQTTSCVQIENTVFSSDDFLSTSLVAASLLFKGIYNYTGLQELINDNIQHTDPFWRYKSSLTMPFSLRARLNKIPQFRFLSAVSQKVGSIPKEKILNENFENNKVAIYHSVSNSTITEHSLEPSFTGNIKSFHSNDSLEVYNRRCAIDNINIEEIKCSGQGGLSNCRLEPHVDLIQLYIDFNKSLHQAKKANKTLKYAKKKTAEYQSPITNENYKIKHQLDNYESSTQDIVIGSSHRYGPHNENENFNVERYLNSNPVPNKTAIQAKSEFHVQTDPNRMISIDKSPQLYVKKEGIKPCFVRDKAKILSPSYELAFANHTKQELAKAITDDPTTGEGYSRGTLVNLAVEKIKQQIYTSDMNYESQLNDNRNAHSRNLLKATDSNFDNSYLELSIRPSTSNNSSTFELETQSVTHEESYPNKLSSLLKIREKLLIDITKTQIALLEIQKDRIKSKGQSLHISTIKKKQRSLLMKMELRRQEIKRLLQRNEQGSGKIAKTLAKTSSRKWNKKPFNSSRKSLRMLIPRYADPLIHGSVSSTSTTYSTLETPQSLVEILRNQELNIRKQRQHLEYLILHQGEKLQHMYTKSSSEFIKNMEPHLKTKDIFLSSNESLATENSQNAVRAEMDKRLKDINNSLSELQNISATSKNSIAGEAAVDYVSTTGAKLNKLWRRLTAQNIKKYEPTKNYSLCKDDFKKMYNEAKATILRNFANSDYSISTDRPISEYTVSTSLPNTTEAVDYLDFEYFPCVLNDYSCMAASTLTESDSERKEIYERKKLIEQSKDKFVKFSKMVAANYFGLHDSAKPNHINLQSDLDCLGEENNQYSTEKQSESTTNPENLKTETLSFQSVDKTSIASSEGKEVDQESNINIVIKSDEGDEVFVKSFPEYDAQTSGFIQDNKAATKTDDQSKDDTIQIGLLEKSIIVDQKITISQTIEKLDNESISQAKFASESALAETNGPLVLEKSTAIHENINTSNQVIPDNINDNINYVEQQKPQHAVELMKPSENISNVPYVYLREIPNKPPPPYVPPAPGSPMTTIFPSEDRIKSLTYRRTHELFCQLLNIDFVNKEGKPLSSVMEETITNIYERIILDICKEFLEEHSEVLRQVDPLNFNSPLIFYNPPDRLRCIQDCIYKKVQCCLAFDKASAKRSQSYSIYGHRVKRDHIGKIILQELYEEDSQWCNFRREENEVLRLIVEELIAQHSLQIVNDVWTEFNSCSNEPTSANSDCNEELLAVVDVPT